MYFVLATITILIIVIYLYIKQLLKRNEIKQISGPLLLPIVGNLLEFSSTPEENFHDMLRLVNKYGSVFQLNLGLFNNLLIVADYKAAEIILSSSKFIDKGDQYDMFLPWLGYGLLISNGNKWRKHRKLLTPAFHFNILEESSKIFSDASSILIDQLTEHANNEIFDIYPFIANCALDIICETAMGVKIDAQLKQNSEYVCAVRKLCVLTFKRILSLFERSDFIYNNFSINGYEYRKALNIVHRQTLSIIQERRKILIESQSNGQSTKRIQFDVKPKRKAFLDILLESRIDGEPLNDTAIQEEVDTFMFEGHDTVSSSVAFTLYLLANNQRVQNKVFNEIREVLGDDKQKLPTLAELNQLKYMDIVIKESLRLYPSVPLITRRLNDNLNLGTYTVPSHFQIALPLYGIHRDPDIFQDPDEFIPERHLNENIPIFSFTPFSAGPRNCIGQRFAMYEMKSLLSKILINFELLPAGPGYELVLLLSIILKSSNGINIKLKPRQY